VSAVEEKIGLVTDDLNRVGVAVVRLTDGDLRLGDRVKITGRTTELTQMVESLQIEHQGVEHASRGTAVGMKVQEPVRRHDQVFRVRDG
jgi:translation elongation factor EF-1alpha